MHVYVLTPVDCPEIMMTLEEFTDHFDDPDYFPLVTKERVKEEVVIAKELFTNAGWEGDGTMRIMWIPPFIKGGTSDTWGDFAYFIKQSNNGICYVCTHHPIPIEESCDLR